MQIIRDAMDKLMPCRRRRQAVEKRLARVSELKPRSTRVRRLVSAQEK